VFKVLEPAGMTEAFTRAFNARDLDALLALYEAFPAGMAAGEGVRAALLRSELAAALAGLLEMPLTLAMRRLSSAQLDGLVLLRVHWLLLDQAGGTAGSGSSVKLLRRQPDGAWLQVVDPMTRSSLPQPAGMDEA
jgi:ketosteroid isomerase-like protein